MVYRACKSNDARFLSSADRAPAPLLLKNNSISTHSLNKRTFVASHEAVVGEYSVMDMVPSEDAAARRRPSSWGAHAMLLMDAECRVPGEM
jgi:hypothetical protein